MSDSLCLARDALWRGEHVRAMECLLDRWRASPTSDVAEVILRLDERMPMPKVAGFVGGAAYERRWTRKAAASDVAWRGRFATMIDRVARLEVMMSHAPDPRLSAAVAAILADLRPAFGGAEDATRALWLRCAEVVDELADPALLALRHAPAPWNAEWNVGGLTLRLDAALNALARRFPSGPPQLDDGQRDTLRAIALALDPPAAIRRRAAEDELLSAIYAAPTDDAPRLVYADWLLEQGDQRGELIQLQLAGALDDPSPRPHPLLQRARRLWVGPLAPVVSMPIFRRGFVAQAQVAWRHRGNLQRLGAHPAWSTLEAVVFVDDGEHSWVPQHLDATVATSIRELHGVDDTGVASLCAAGQAWSVRKLSVQAHTNASHRLLEETTRLPHLEDLHIIGESSLSWLYQAHLRLCLRTLTVQVQGRRDLWKLQTAAARLPALEHVEVVVSPGVRLALTRGPEHRFTHAVVSVAQGGPENILDLLDMAPEFAFTGLEIHASFSPSQLRRLDDAAARQRGLDDIVVMEDIPT